MHAFFPLNPFTGNDISIVHDVVQYTGILKAPIFERLVVSPDELDAIGLEMVLVQVHSCTVPGQVGIAPGLAADVYNLFRGRCAVNIQ